MNAAARLVHPGVVSRRLILSHLLSFKQIILLILTLSVLFSALSIIYTTHSNRLLYALYQHELAEQNNLKIKQGQLILERSTLMTQSRIQQIAESKLGMFVPDHQSLIVIKE